MLEYKKINDDLLITQIELNQYYNICSENVINLFFIIYVKHLKYFQVN
jgi:hypothetical protein